MPALEPVRLVPNSLSHTEAEALIAHLTNLGPTSTFALRMAVMALDTPGVRGRLTIEVPANPKDFPDLRFETS